MKVVRISELAELLGLGSREASSLVNSLVRRGLLSKALVHDVLSEVPRLSEGRGLSLREKLEAFRGRGTWWFTPAGGRRYPT